MPGETALINVWVNGAFCISAHSAFDLCRATVFNRAYCRWGLDRAHRHTRGATRHQLEEVGVFDHLATTTFAPARGPEASHAVADVREEALARRIPVIADVDAGVELSLDYCSSSPLDGFLELRLVKRLASAASPVHLV